MKRVSQATIDELVDIFGKIHDILLREKEDNWIRGINSIQYTLSKTDPSSTNLEQIFKDVGISYRHMNSGQGSFADFMIWRDDFDERRKLNKEFESLAERAWKLLDL